MRWTQAPAEILRRAHQCLKLARLGGRKSWRRVDGKFLMRIDPGDFVDRSFYLGSYDRSLVDFIERAVQPGDVCVDVGAHKGYFTLHLARAVGESGRVLSVEPDHRAMEELRANCQRNGFRQVVLFPLALSEAAGSCEFVLSRQLGYSSRFPNKLARRLELTTVTTETRTLDQIVEETGIRAPEHRLVLVKLDAEGSEPLVLAGMAATLERFGPMLWIEINRESLEAAGFTPTSVEEPLRALGYKLYGIEWRREAGARFRLRFSPLGPLAAAPGACFNVLAATAEPEQVARPRSIPLAAG